MDFAAFDSWLSRLNSSRRGRKSYHCDQQGLPVIMKDNNGKDIYNYEEKKSFSKTASNKSLVFPGDPADESNTVQFISSLAGEKMKLMMIGKSTHPQTLKGMDMRSQKKYEFGCIVRGAPTVI